MSKLDISVSFANKDELEALKTKIIDAVQTAIDEAEFETPSVTVGWNVSE